MSLLLIQDLEAVMDGEFSARALLWPGQAGEREAKGIFDEPALLVELGNDVGHESLAPVFHSTTARLTGLKHGDQVRILANPDLGIDADRNYTVKRGPIPDGPGGALIELRKA